MKKILTSLFVFAALLGSAQNLSTYGLLGNPGNINQNPGADPLSKFYLSLPNMNAGIGLNQTAGTLFGSTDILANISGLSTPALTANQEYQVDLVGLGLKLGNNFIYAGSNIQFTSAFSVDKDLVGFLKYGMVDANGDYDPNYTGDFSETGLSVDVASNYFLGYQRKLMEDKLRVGVSYTLNNYLAGARTIFNSLEISSSEVATTGMNALNIGYDLDLTMTGVLDENATIDSLNQIGDHLMFNDPNFDFTTLLTESRASKGTFGLGITYKPVNVVELQFSMTGISGGMLDINGKSFSSTNSTTLEGFSYTSVAGDSLSSSVGNAFSAYTEELQNSISTEVVDGTGTFSYGIPMITNVGANFFLGKRSYVGAHYTSRSNSIRDYEYLGFNGMWWLTKGLQLKGGYYLTLDETNFDLINAAVQFRLSPLIQMHIGTNSVSPMATFVNANMPNNFETTYVGASTNAMNFSFGITMFNFYDNRFKKEREERKANKASKSAEQKLTPAEKKKIEDSYNESSTVKTATGGGL